MALTGALVVQDNVCCLQEAQALQVALREAEARAAHASERAETAKRAAQRVTELEAALRDAADKAQRAERAQQDQQATAGRVAELEAELERAKGEGRKSAELGREVRQLRVAGLRAAELASRLADREARLEKLRAEVGHLLRSPLHALGWTSPTCSSLLCAARLRY